MNLSYMSLLCACTIKTLKLYPSITNFSLHSLWLVIYPICSIKILFMEHWVQVISVDWRLPTLVSPARKYYLALSCGFSNLYLDTRYRNMLAVLLELARYFFL